jgi:hypothetical protein
MKREALEKTNRQANEMSLYPATAYDSAQFWHSEAKNDSSD